MPRVLLQLLVFVLVCAGVSAGLAVLASLAFPGRGFLPIVRNWYRVDFDRDASGAWAATRTVPIGTPHITAPTSGASVVIQELSMGRWDPGAFSAWRHRNWILESCVDQNGERMTLVATAGAEASCPQELLDAILTHAERAVIPNSRVWELWPIADPRSAVLVRSASQGPIRWSGTVRGTSGTAVAVVVAVGITAGLAAALQLRRRTVPAPAPPS